MKLSVKKTLGASLVLGITTLSLCAQSAAQFGNLPLWFEAGESGQFTAHASDSQFTISPTGAKFTLANSSGETAVCQLEFIDANPAALIAGNQMLSGTINYLIGNNPDQWRANVHTFAQVRVENIYPGVNVVYYGNRQKLEYDFKLAAGVNPSVIALRFAGAENVSVNPQGALVIRFQGGEVIQHPPVAYQTIGDTRQEIAASYKMVDAHTVAFSLGNYDRTEPLVIDPVLTYSTYFGGNDGDTGWAIAVNPIDGSIYVAGSTFSTKNTNSANLTFSTPNAYQTNYLGGKQAGDAFIARFDNSGTNLIYATYLGGNADDSAYAIAVDTAGNAFIAGGTISTNFPVKNPIAGGNKISGTMDRTIKLYPTDIFVAELDPSGSNLLYSTYLGGSRAEAAFGIALDADDNAFITGFTYSTNFPVTVNAFQPRRAFTNTVLNANAFVSEISVGGSNLNYSTYLGGTNYDVGRAIAYNAGKVFVAGYTSSTNFPTLNYILGTNIVWTNHLSQKIHGTNNYYDSVITNYFVGNLLNGFTTNKDKHYVDLNYDAFVTAFAVAAPTNLTLLYSTLLGGTNADQATGIAADSDGNAYVCGYTTSTNFPDTVTEVIGSYIHTNTDRNALNYVTNGFLTKIQWDGTNASFSYSAMFGGKGGDVANGVVLDADNNAYVIGTASSTNYPTYNTYGDLSPTNHYLKKRFYNDVVVTALNADASVLLFSAYIGGYDNDYGNAIAVDPVGNLYLAGQTISTNFPTVNAFQSRINDKKKTDMFVAKITQFVPPVPNLIIAPVIIKPSVQNKVAGTQLPVKSGIHLQWQMFPANYAVESSSDMSHWQPAPVSPTYSNGCYHVILPTTNGAGFFRLHKR
jgi:hypothetical protein